MPKKKIGMVLEHTFPPDIRVEKEARALRNAGFDVSLLSKGNPALPSRQDWEGVRVVRADIPVDGTFANRFYRLTELISFRSLIWTHCLEKFIDEEQPDVLHVHDLRLARTALLVAEKRSLPVVVDLHENYPAAMQEWGKGSSDITVRLQRTLATYSRLSALEKGVLSRATHAIAVVDEMKERMVSQHGTPPEKITVITNTEETTFVKATEYDPEIIRKYAGYFTLLYIGGFGPHRGLDTAIAGTCIAKKTIPNLKLVLVGKGRPSFETALREMVARHHAEDFIDLVGWQPFEKVPSFMKAALIGLVPHHSNEHTDSTIPHKLFQYMMIGTPVLVSTCKPLARIVSEINSGAIFDASNPESFAERVVFLWENDQIRDEMARNGVSATLNGNYNWAVTGRALVGVYHVLIGPPASYTRYKHKLIIFM